MFIQLLSLLISRHSNPGTIADARTQEGWVVKKDKRLFRENLCRNLTLGEVARHLGVDPFRLVRAFNQELGLPPHVYLDCLRIREAQRLLEKGLPLAEVALRAGYTDQSHFTKRFKRQIGITPGRYLH